MAWLEKILVPIDFSPCSEAALRYAAFLSDFYGAAIEVLHVIESQPPSAQLPSSGDALVRQRQSEIASLLARISPAVDPQAAVRVERGRPATVIGRRSRNGCSLVVIGRSRHGWRRSSRTGTVLRALLDQGLPCGVFPVDLSVRLPRINRQAARAAPAASPPGR